MKKKYSLDYNIKTDAERLQAVKDILDQLPTNPSPTELEQMASYILYGKDEDGKNAVQRGEVTDSTKRYNSFKRAADKVQSLDEILDNPLNDQQALQPMDSKYIYTKKKPTIQRPKYNKAGEMIDPGDSDVPGMQQLWDCIDHLEHVLAANKGLVPFNDDDTVLPNDYRLYQLNHMLIDVRRHQYYLKDSYKPTLHFLAIQQPKPQTYNWDTDGFYWISYEEWQKRTSAALLHTVSKNIEDYETRETPEGSLEVKWIVRHHHFDWENPRHIKALIDNYSAIYMETREKLDSWGRTLIYDFDRYYDMVGFSPLREYILTRKIDKAPYALIIQELQEKYGLTYNENHLSNIIAREIPERIASAARRYRLITETPISEKKRCFTCGQFFPRDSLFFTTNHGRKDGLASNCKECERKKRLAKGGASTHDRRNKDTTLLEMPPRTSNS